MSHVYVFYYRKGNPIPFYERTCGSSIDRANQRVKELTSKPYNHMAAFYLVDQLPEKYYY